MVRGYWYHGAEVAGENFSVSIRVVNTITRWDNNNDNNGSNIYQPPRRRRSL